MSQITPQNGVFLKREEWVLNSLNTYPVKSLFQVKKKSTCGFNCDRKHKMWYCFNHITMPPSVCAHTLHGTSFPAVALYQSSVPGLSGHLGGCRSMSYLFILAVSSLVPLWGCLSTLSGICFSCLLDQFVANIRAFITGLPVHTRTPCKMGLN